MIIVYRNNFMVIVDHAPLHHHLSDQCKLLINTYKCHACITMLSNPLKYEMPPQSSVSWTVVDIKTVRNS